MTSTRTTATALGTLLLASALAGCTPTAATEPSTGPSTDHSTEPSPTDASPSATSVAWVDYTVPSGLASFELPADWTVEVIGDIQVDLHDPQGEKQLTFIEHIGGIGGDACEAPVPFEVLDSVEIPVAVEDADPQWSIPPQIAYRIIQDGSGYIGSIGTTDSVSGFDGVSCGWFNLIDNPVLGTFMFATEFVTAPGYTEEGIPLTFASVAEAEAFMDTEEYATLIRILTSITI